MRRGVLVVMLLVAAVVAVWTGSRVVTRVTTRPPQTPSAPAPAASTATAHITATLYYATADGLSLAGVRREVPLAAGVVAQGREILLAQLQDAPMPYLSTVPKGTMLRAFYVTDRGDAFVDVTGDITKAHPGGTLNEMLTVDTIVDAVTANLPAVRRVQILVDGKEVDTIAGHVDVRRPLERDNTLVK